MLHSNYHEEFNVNIESGEKWWYAHVIELQGCFSRGSTRDEVLTTLPIEIIAHLERLKTWGFECPSFRGFKIAEETYNIPSLGEAGGAVALFESDHLIIDLNDLDLFIRLMTLNRNELLKITEHLPVDVMRSSPIPGKWSIEETLSHVVNAEEWYVSRIGLKYQQFYEHELEASTIDHSDVVVRLRVTRPCLVKVIELAFRDNHRSVFKRKEYTRYPEEPWTLRKVLRRFVEHEREHISTIKRTLEKL